VNDLARKYDYELEIREDMYNKAYIPYLVQSRSTEIFYGGSSSGKSNFVAQRTIENILEGGHNYLCCRKMGNSITKSVFNELTKAITKLKVGHLFNVVPSQGHITCVNGYQILFTGLDDVEKVKSITPKFSVITDIWCEESTELTYTDIKQLRKRLRGIAAYDGRTIQKRIILTFNPIYKTHWLYKEYFEANGWKNSDTEFISDRLSILKTTHLDNDFLDAEDHLLLEEESDLYWFSVYTKGDFGILGDAIFTNWRTEDLSSKKESFDRIRNGLDFGYSSDPNAYVRVHYDKPAKKIYIFEAWQEKKLTNPMIADKLKPTIGREPIFCDSAEPKSIAELQADGIDARPVKKGKDSVLHGIKWIQKHEVIVDESLQPVINELNTYQWKKDKDGVALPIPCGDDHFLDAVRYSLEVEHTGFFEGMV